MCTTSVTEFYILSKNNKNKKYTSEVRRLHRLHGATIYIIIYERCTFSTLCKNRATFYIRVFKYGPTKIKNVMGYTRM